MYNWDFVFSHFPLVCSVYFNFERICYSFNIQQRSLVILIATTPCSFQQKRRVDDPSPRRCLIAYLQSSCRCVFTVMNDNHVTMITSHHVMTSRDSQFDDITWSGSCRWRHTILDDDDVVTWPGLDDVTWTWWRHMVGIRWRHVNLMTSHGRD